MAACGVVGESTNLTAAYRAAVSRKLDSPLAVLIQSSSAAGKSSLMDVGAQPDPARENGCNTAPATGQSLFYSRRNQSSSMGRSSPSRKKKACAELAYAPKLLQSGRGNASTSTKTGRRQRQLWSPNSTR